VPIWWRRTSGVEELCPTNLNHHNGAFIVAREGHFCGGFFDVTYAITICYMSAPFLLLSEIALMLHTQWWIS
jgi:hypothetical protein